MTRKTVPALLALQPMMGHVTPEGRVLSQVPIGEPTVIDTVDLEQRAGSHELVIKSRTSGESVSVGYDPAYAEGFDRIFGARM